MGELRPYRQSPKQALLAAISKFTEVDPMDGAEWAKAWHRVRVSARRYVLADKPTDPRGKGE